MKITLTTLLLLFVSVIGWCQQTQISGTVLDAELNNSPLPFASVTIKNTTNGVNTDMDGHFFLQVEPGNYVLEISFLGYKTELISVEIKEGESKEISIILKSDFEEVVSKNNSLADLVIKIETNRQKETALLAEQKRAIDIKTTIGAQELSRKGISDASSALTKVSGITKNENSGQLFVRGLGDRYNSSFLNGLPITSNNPEYKNIDLSLFPSDVIQHISIDKTFNTSLTGDFGGAAVDIFTKNFTGSPFLELEIGSAVNTNAVGVSNFMLNKGFNSFGFQGFSNPQSTSLFAYNFSRSLGYDKQNPFGGQISLKGGKSFSVGNEGKISLFGTAGISNGFIYKGGFTRSAQAQGDFLKNLNQEIYQYSTNTTAMANVGYKINSNHNINANYFFVNSSNLSTDFYRGYIRDIADNGLGLITRNTFKQNQLHIFQLLGNHKIKENLDLNWGTSYNKIKGFMPDRTQNTLVYNSDLSDYIYATNSTTDNHRYFQELVEDEIAINGILNYKFLKSGDKYKAKLTLGYNGRFKNRNFYATQYNFKIASNIQQADVLNMDSFFNQSNLTNDLFSIKTYNGLNSPQYYFGEQNIHAGFGTLSYTFSDRLQAQVGLRIEQIQQNVTWLTQLSTREGFNALQKTAFLPNAIVKYQVKDNHNLRFAASKTYTLPQFKERALFIYEDVTEIKVGNPFVYASDNYNLDLKWEYFLSSSEIFSITAFGKYILNPINEITIASATNDTSFANTGDFGHAIGVEAEIRKNIFDFKSEKQNKITAGLNAAYMKTNQELNSSKVNNETKGTLNTNFTYNNASFTGASNLILNADLTYFKEFKTSNLQATLAYNYFSDRLYAIGTETKGNLIDKGFGTLDFILNSKLTNKLSLKFTYKNILNPKIERVQENQSKDVLVGTYTKGSGLNLSLSYIF